MLLDGWHLLGEARPRKVAVEKIAICGPPTRDGTDRRRSLAPQRRASDRSDRVGAERVIASQLADRRRRERGHARP